MNHPQGRPSPLAGWALAGLVLLVSLAEFRALLLLHRAHLGELAAAAWNLTQGQPHWREYQNRLMGPWLARLMAGGTPGAFTDAFLACLLLLTAAKNLAAQWVATRLTGSLRVGTAAALAGSLLFLLAQDQNWLYLWDPIDAVVFSLFLYGALSRRGLLFFALLFAAALLNRESALFIALWLVLDAFTFKRGGRWSLPRLRDPLRAGLGAALLAAGQAFTWGVRQWLLVGETAPALNPAFAAERPLHLATNLRTLWHSLSQPGWESLVLLLPFLAFALGAGAFLLLLLKGGEGEVALALVGLCMLGSIALVGLVNESRIYSMLIPFAVLLPLSPAREKGTAP